MKATSENPHGLGLLERLRYSWFPLWTGSDRVVVVLYFALHRWQPKNASRYFFHLWDGYSWGYRIRALLRWLSFPLTWDAWEAKSSESRHRHWMRMRFPRT
jgi:hypothetical protein